MTPELVLLRKKLEVLGDLVDELELELVEDPQWAEPSDTSYLNADDRANPDIMANVEAMAETNKLIAWFGRDMEGFVGLWRGADQVALAKAPIVRLDTEGQYELVASSIGDYLCIAASDDDFDENRKMVTKAGLAVSGSPDEIWEAIEDYDSPNDYRHQLYNAQRKQRGLPPISG